MKSRLRIEGEGTRGKEDGGGKANEGNKKDLKNLLKYISSSLSGFSLRHIYR